MWWMLNSLLFNHRAGWHIYHRHALTHPDDGRRRQNICVGLWDRKPSWCGGMRRLASDWYSLCSCAVKYVFSSPHHKHRIRFAQYAAISACDVCVCFASKMVPRTTVEWVVNIRFVKMPCKLVAPYWYIRQAERESIVIVPYPSSYRRARARIHRPHTYTLNRQ